MRRLVRRWLGMDRTDEMLKAIIEHQGIKLQEQPRYKIIEPKSLGFKEGK